MVLDPIRPNDVPTVPDAAPARSTSVRLQPDKQTAQATPSVQPVAAPVPTPRDEVNVKWDRSDGVIVTFTDKKSGDIVRQIPSEQVLNVARFIRQLLEQENSGQQTDFPTGSEEMQ